MRWNIIKYLVIALISIGFGLACAGGDGGTGAEISDGGTSPEGVDQELYDCMGEEDKALLDDPDLPDHVRELVIGSAICPEPETTADLIMKAVAEGRLTEDQGHIFLFLAVADPDRVPPEFRSDAELTEKDVIFSVELQWIMEHYDEIPEEVRTAYNLQQYILDGDDPASFFYPRMEKAKSVSKAGGGSAYEERYIYETLPNETNAIGTFRYLPDYEDNAKEIEKTVYAAMPKLKAMYGGVQPANFVIKCYLFSGPKHSLRFIDGNCDIEISHELKDVSEIKEYTIYDLAQCYHYEMYKQAMLQPMYSSAYHIPLRLAAATYAIDLVYQDLNREWRELKPFFSNLQAKQWTGPYWKQNAMYVWFLFLNQQKGITAVTDTLTRGLVNGLEAIHQYADQYREYVVRDFNQPQFFHRHKDIPDFPWQSGYCGGDGTCRPKGAITFERIGGVLKKDVPFTLPEGAMNYHHYSFDSFVQQVVFTFKPKPDPMHGIQVYVRSAEGEWSLRKEIGPEGGEVSICLQKENITDVLIMLSNAWIIGSAWKNTYQMETFDSCARKGYTYLKRTVTVDGFTSTGTLKTADTLMSIDEGTTTAYYLRSRKVVEFSLDQGIIDATIRCKGSKEETYSEDEAPEKFYLANITGEMTSQDQTGTFVPFLVFEDEDWVTCKVHAPTIDPVTVGSLPFNAFFAGFGSENIPLKAAEKVAEGEKAGKIYDDRIIGDMTYEDPIDGSIHTIKFEYELAPY